MYAIWNTSKYFFFFLVYPIVLIKKNKKNCSRVINAKAQRRLWNAELDILCAPSPFEKTSKYKEKCNHYLTALKVFCCSLTFLSGKLKRNSRSKRPGLLSAGSIESSLFVAPTTTISPRLSRPSIKAKSVDTIELWTGNETELNAELLISHWMFSSVKAAPSKYFLRMATRADLCRESATFISVTIQN